MSLMLLIHSLKIVQTPSLMGSTAPAYLIVTDNGPTFTSVWEDGCHAFTEFLEQRGIDHHRIPAYYPEANGKAEAAVKIVKREALGPFFTAMPAWIPGQL